MLYGSNTSGNIYNALGETIEPGHFKTSSLNCKRVACGREHKWCGVCVSEEIQCVHANVIRVEHLTVSSVSDHFKVQYYAQFQMP